MKTLSVSKGEMVCAGQAGRMLEQAWIGAVLAAMCWAAMFRPEQAMGQASGAGSAGSPAAQVAPADPNDQYLEALGRLMDELGCRQTYYPPMAQGRMGGWNPGPANQIRQNIPLSQVLRTYRNEGRLEFEDFTQNNDPKDDDASGEYDPDRRVVRINIQLRGGILTNIHIASLPKTRPTGRTNAYTSAFVAIQTFHHELVHLRQREHERVNPGSRQSEAQAYRSALDLAQQWIHSLQELLEKEPTLDRAHRLQAACKAWDDYIAAIKNAMKNSERPPDRSVFDGPFRDRSGKPISLQELTDEITDIQKQTRQIEMIIRVLGSLQAKGGAYGRQADDLVGWDQLSDRLEQAGAPLDTEAQLEAFLKQAAQKAAQSNNPLWQQQSGDQIYAEIRPSIPKLWRETRRRGFQEALVKLVQHPPQATWQLDPKDGFLGGSNVGKVTVTLRTTDQLPQMISRARKLAEDIFDPPDRPTISVKDCWTDPNGAQKIEDWTADPPEQVYQLGKPGKYTAQLQRTVYVGGKDHAYPPIKIPFAVPPTMPDNAAGQWIGSLVIKEFIVSMENQQPQRCQQLENAQFRMTMDWQPTGPTAGRLVVELTPEKLPADVAKAAKDSRASGSYTLSAPRFSGEMITPQGKLPLEGQFEFANGVWHIRSASTASTSVSLGEGGRATVKYSWSVSQIKAMGAKP